MTEEVKNFKDKLTASLPHNRHFWYLMVNAAVAGLASTMIGPFLPVFLYKTLNISVGAVSFLYFISGLVGTITVFFVGWLVDRVGRRIVYIFGSSNSAWVPAVLTIVRNFNQAFPVFALFGVMDSAQRTSQTTIIADQVEDRKRNTAYGINRVVVNAAWIVAPILGGFLLTARSGFNELFLISALLGSVSLAVFIGFVPESRRTDLEKPKLPRISVLKDPDLLLLCVASLFSMLFYSQYYSLLPIFATQVRGLSEVQVGALFSISGLTVVILQLPTSNWLQKIPKQLGYIMGVVIMAMGITGIALAPDFYWLMGASALMTVGENMFFPIASALVTEIAPEADRGMYVGAFSLFLSVGANVSPLLGGMVWQVTGNAELPWLLSPIYAGISVALAVYYRLKHPR